MAHNAEVEEGVLLQRYSSVYLPDITEPLLAFPPFISAPLVNGTLSQVVDGTDIKGITLER